MYNVHLAARSIFVDVIGIKLWRPPPHCISDIADWMKVSRYYAKYMTAADGGELSLKLATVNKAPMTTESDSDSICPSSSTEMMCIVCGDWTLQGWDDDMDEDDDDDDEAETSHLRMAAADTDVSCCNLTVPTVGITVTVSPPSPDCSPGHHQQPRAGINLARFNVNAVTFNWHTVVRYEDMHCAYRTLLLNNSMSNNCDWVTLKVTF